MTYAEERALKPCPFCGGIEIYQWGCGKWDRRAFCGGCGAGACRHETGEEAAAAWNRRAEWTPKKP